jgi:hypothetical protein
VDARPHPWFDSRETGFQGSERALKRLCGVLAGVGLAACAAAADAPGFVGRVVVEWLDDDPFIARMRLVEDFAFRDPAGRKWVAEKEHVLDGRSIPLLFRDLIGPPFAGEYRKSTVVYEYQAHRMQAPWRAVHRLFYDASRAEGVPDSDAKLMYMALYAGGLRWEQRSSSCFSHCHAAAESLSWMPVTTPEEMKPIVDWIRQTNPGLDQIDRRLDATLRKPGPHIFVQGFSSPIVADPEGAAPSQPPNKE